MIKNPHRPGRFFALPSAALLLAAVVLSGCAAEDSVRSPGSPGTTDTSQGLTPLRHPAAAVRQQADDARQDAAALAADPGNRDDRDGESSPAAPQPQPRQDAPATPAQPSAGQQQERGGKCTDDPADRAGCRLPDGAEIEENGGDVDGDGAYEQNEPVGPGYKDPRAYDGGKTSGEVQCEYLRQQGIDC